MKSNKRLACLVRSLLFLRPQPRGRAPLSSPPVLPAEPAPVGPWLPHYAPHKGENALSPHEPRLELTFPGNSGSHIAPGDVHQLPAQCAESGERPGRTETFPGAPLGGVPWSQVRVARFCGPSPAACNRADLPFRKEKSELQTSKAAVPERFLSPGEGPFGQTP